MAIITFPAGIKYPSPPFAAATVNSALSATALAASVASAKVGWVFPAPKSGNIRKICWTPGTVTTGGTLDVRLETIDAAGLPSGSLAGTNTNASRVLVVGDANTWLTDTLTADATVTQGQKLAVSISNPGASPANFNARGFTAMGPDRFPFCLTHNGTVWAKNQTVRPVFALEYSDGSYAPIQGCIPASAFASTAFNSGSTPDERGIRFKFPTKVRVCGYWALLGNMTAAMTAAMKLYDSDGTTAFTSVTIDSDLHSSLSSYGLVQDIFPASVTLLADTYYRLALAPASATNWTLGEVTSPSAAVQEAMEWGSACLLTTRTDAGAWTDSTVTRPWMGLIIDGTDNAERVSVGLSL